MLWLWNFFLERRQFSYVLLAALVISGGAALLAIPKENNPPIVIPYGIVVTTLPGASASDIETLVTDKIEEQVSGLSNMDTLTSESSDGVSVVTAQFNASANVNQSIQDLRDAVAKAVPNLPADASAPSVSKIDFSKMPIMVVSIAGGLPPTELSALGTEVSNDLKRITGVSEVDVAGVPLREVDIIVRKEALAQYGLSLSQVVGAIQASNAALPAGSISMQGVNYDVNFKGGITKPSEVSSIAVGARNGAPIYLRDIAVISDGLAPVSTYSRLSEDGKPAAPSITLTIYKQSGASIQGVATAVRTTLASLQGSTLKGLTVFVPPSTDQGTQVGKQLGSLAETGAITVLLVVLVLLITIGWREALVAALSIPLSFLIAFLALYLNGQSLNFISLFALILAVGILVDSGIVVTEAIHARTRLYGDSMKAARVALKDYAWPLIAGTMATIAVFAPLFFISGIIGQYITGIPYTVIFVLLASIFVALGMVPLIAIVLTRSTENRLGSIQERYTERVTEWYKGFLRRMLESPRRQRIFLRTLATLFLVSLVLPFTGLISTVFLPQGDQDFVYLNITKPEGTTLEETDLAAREVEELLYHDPNVASFQTTVGQSSSQDNGGGSSGPNQANITVNLPMKHVPSTQVITELENRLAPIKDATVQVLQASGGPPSSAPIFIQFKGDDLDALIAAADNGKQLLAHIPHTTNISASTANNGTELDLTIDRAKAAAYGVTPLAVAQTLRAAVNGQKATSITQPSQDVDVIVRVNLNPSYVTPADTTKTTLDAIENLTVPGTKGPVLLGSVLTSSLAESNASISHKDKLRLETVSAYPDDKTTASAVVAEFQKRIGELHLPPGITVSYGGESEDINKSFTEMFIALIAGLVLMFMILIIGFNSFRYTGYLLMIVPLSLIGVLDGLALTGQPISFSSLLGVIALGGVIINHAIILMDSMILHLKEEPTKPIIDVVIDSAATRLRPIVLTTIATVIGMIPLSFASPIWGPLAYAIMFGLTFAIVLTLALVPVLFYRAPHPGRIK